MKIRHVPLSLIGIVPAGVGAHTRLECPPPRSGETGVKQGPCDAPDDLSLPAHPLVPGAFNTITWLESIPHPGAPARLALSLDGDDSAESFESCILLDHIPHDEYSVPNFLDPSSWHRSSITIWVPNVKCERCHLQLMTVMSDEAHGVPEGTSCAYAGALAAGGVADATLPACPFVYHSCAPVSIDGVVPRNELSQCPTAEFEERLGWPRRPGDSDGNYYDPSTYYYKGDPGLYNLTTSRLMKAGAPIEGCDSVQFCDPEKYLDVTARVPEDAKYASLSGTCAETVYMEVEAFELGALPSTPKDITAQPKPPTFCDSCSTFESCFSEQACSLRDPTSGAWSGPAAQCAFGAPPCEECFADSPCFGYGSGGGKVADADAAAGEAAAGEVAGEVVADKGDGAAYEGNGTGATKDDMVDGSGGKTEGEAGSVDGADEDGTADTDGQVTNPPSSGGSMCLSCAAAFLSVILGAITKLL